MAVDIILPASEGSGVVVIKGGNHGMQTQSTSGSISREISKRDGLAFPIVFVANGADTGEWVCVITNTSDLDMIVEDIGVNSVLATRFQLELVTVGAVTGTAVNVINGNTALPKDFSNFATAFEALNLAGGIVNLTSQGLFDQVWTTGTSDANNGHQEMRLKGIVRIAQGKSVALKTLEMTATEDVGGVIFVTFE